MARFRPLANTSPERQAATDSVRGNPLLRRILPWFIRSLGLLVLVALAALGVDIIGAMELMFEARPAYLLPAFLVFCMALFMRMIVWLILARWLRLGYRRQRSYVRLYLIGWSAGLGLPVGASPLARAAVLASDKRSVGRGVIADILDRLLQVATFGVLLIASAAYLSTESTRVLLGVGIGAAVIAGAIPLALAGAWLVRPLIRRILAYHWMETFTEDVSAALKEVRRAQPTQVAGLLLLAMIPSLLSVTALLLTSRALEVPLSFPVLMAASAAVGLATLLPISINGLGPREGIFAAAVAGAGFSSEAGVALGLLWFAMATVTRLAAAASWFMNSDDSADAVSTANQPEAEGG